MALYSFLNPGKLSDESIQWLQDNAFVFVNPNAKVAKLAGERIIIFAGVALLITCIGHSWYFAFEFLAQTFLLGFIQARLDPTPPKELATELTDHLG